MQALYLWLWRLVPGNPQVVRIVQGASRRNQHALVRLGEAIDAQGTQAFYSGNCGTA